MTFAKLLLACSLAAIQLFAAPAQAQSAAVTATLSANEAASRLRVVPQRLSKLYLQTRLNIDRELSTVRIEDGIKQFDGLLAVVQRSQPGGKAQATLLTIEQKWAKMRVDLTELPNDAVAQRLSADAEQLAAAAQLLTTQLDADPSPIARLADMALRNDMLAQRMARLYMQVKAGAGGNQSADIEKIRKEFAEALTALSEAPQTSNTIRSNIDLARLQWGFFEAAVGTKGWDEANVRNVATTSERISQVLSDIAISYRKMRA
ncbi:hypothetical protein [Uliginosibacterium sp. H1]|uniref:hypothetical protein n=1 Tax=Uliginosibacterium sp. H1 TaxID=3114757 RepID=UPI002E16E689|nr:hypothetical protein [Uliginosibacterium sp. H1]